jgi:hypothetical protein
MTGTEWNESVEISLWEDEHDWPLISANVDPQLRAQAEEKNRRHVEIQQAAQLRAEELDRKDPDAWPEWKISYRKIDEMLNKEQQQPEAPATTDRMQRMRQYWDSRTRINEIYRSHQADTLKELFEHGGGDSTQ